MMFFLAISALASSPMASGAQAETPAKPVTEKKICRMQGPVTGSYLGGKTICRTKADWAKVAKANDLDQEQFRRNIDMQSGRGFDRRVDR